MSSHLSRAARAGIALSVLLLVPFAVGSGTAADIQPGTLTAAHFRSAVLGEDISYNVYLPAGYASTAKHYPVLYLLHGRGDSMSAWTQVKGKLDAMIADGRIPPTIAIMPDAPWSSRASYYVDSAYRGADPGRKVETAFTTDLIQNVDSTYRTIPSRDGRVIGGYSMGGYGAMRYSIAHPDLFAAVDRAQPGRLLPDAAERLEHAGVRRLRPGTVAVLRRQLPQAQLPRRVAAVQREEPAVAHVHRGR